VVTGNMYRSISNNSSVGEFVWPGAWLLWLAGGRASGRTGARAGGQYIMTHYATFLPSCKTF